MNAIYPVTYRDKFGEVTTTLVYDGKLVRVILRDVEFTTFGFCGFEPPVDCSESQLQSFDLFLGELCSYTLDFDIPVWVSHQQGQYQLPLHVHVERGAPAEGEREYSVRCRDGSVVKERRQIFREVLQFAIIVDGQTYRSDGRSRYDSFDEQLTDLTSRLPQDFHLRMCWTCAFSDYNPSGSGSLGQLACFRNTKDQYLKARTKSDMLTLWPQRAEEVTETYICPEYELRRAGSGLYIGEEYPGKRG